MKVEFIVDGRVVARKNVESSLEADQDHYLEPLEAQPLVVTRRGREYGRRRYPS